jgi:hypothetical protein
MIAPTDQLILKLTIVMVGNLHTIVPAASHISGINKKNALERMNLQQLHIVINNLTIATTTIHAMSRIHYQSD